MCIDANKILCYNDNITVKITYFDIFMILKYVENYLKCVIAIYIKWKGVNI